MSKRPAKPMADAAPGLSIPERILLFCVASDTDWEHAGITMTAMIVRGFIQRDPAGRLWPDHVPVPTFGPRMVCTRCGIIGVDVRPNASLMQCNTPLPRCANSGPYPVAKCAWLVH
jgi:hypothetical protein